MRSKVAALVCFSGLALSGFAATTDPLLETAQYYYAKQEYADSLKLWLQAVQKKPTDLYRVFRLAETSLLVEGRTASRERLRDFLERSYDGLNPEERKEFQTRYSNLQAVFLTEEGQANFLQAQAKLAHRDYASALLHLQQANGLENDHPLVLLTKAETEKHLAEFRATYASLQLAYQADPFSAPVREWLAESHLYYGEPEKALTTLRRYQTEPENVRQKTALAVALAQTGERMESTKILKSLAEREKQWGLNPIVYFTLGKNLATEKAPPPSFRLWLERFINLASNPESSDAPTWDPYRASEKLEEARKLLKSKS